MPDIQSVTPKLGCGEVHPSDDYLSLIRNGKGFNGFNNNIDDPEGVRRKKWAKDTARHANKSINSYLVEMLLKIPSYFIVHSDLRDEWWAKCIFVAERLSGTLGDMFRNLIYGHKDKNGKRDDNIGAEIHAGANPDYSIGVINNHAQTKGRFIVAALGFISPTLANDLEWAIIRALDGLWWRNMGIHLALGPEFGAKLIKRIFGSNETIKGESTWDSVMEQFKGHFATAKESWHKFRSEQTDKEEKGVNFIKLCHSIDKITSSFLPIVNCLNIIGDFARPVARRLGITGIPRNTFRILSVIDKPFFWFTNLFRFYFPEKYIQKKTSKEGNYKSPGSLTHSDLLLGSVIGDIADFGLVIFEDKIKDSSGSFNHIVEIARRMKDSASDIYFAKRRTRALNDLKGTN